MKKIIICLLYSATLAFSATKYVATNGHDANPGTREQPLQTIPQAVSVASPGDTIYVRGGTYSLSSTITISSAKHGSESKKYFLLAFPGERPLLDFSKSAAGAKGITLSARYWHIQGLDIKGAGDNGMEINAGSYNRIEFCSFFENRDSGLQLSNGAAHNQIINCDSYYNADPPDYGDADGFAPKLTVGTGNYFLGCRSWENCDDGWDGYMRGATNVTTTLEQCWTWRNGYLKDGTDPGSQANGNGFKLGGGDNSNSEQLMHHFILKKCLAFENKYKGFDQNNNVGSMTLLNCTGYANKSANYRITRALSNGQTLTVKNCVSVSGSVSLGSFSVQEKNSWLSPFIVTTADFMAMDPAAALAPRKTDGRLPDMAFMHLTPGSDLIDGGVFVDLPFTGKAPDLGAFESPFVSFVTESGQAMTGYRLHQNHPNPFNPQTSISFQLPTACWASLKIYNLTGQEITTLAEGFYQAGEHSTLWHARNVSSGLYLYRLQAGDFSDTKKIEVVK